MSRSKLLLYACLAFIAGIGVASFVPRELLANDLLLFGLAVGFAAILIIILTTMNVPRYVHFVLPARLTAALAVGGLVCCMAMFGVWRYGLALPQLTPADIAYYNGQTVALTGVVSREPDVRTYNQKLTVRANSIMTASVQKRVNGNVLVTAKLYPEHSYGERLQLRCALEAPEPFDEFSYDRYLARHGVYSVCYYPSLTPQPPLPEGEGEFLPQKMYGIILNLKHKLQESINYGLTEPAASLLQAITLGNRRGLTPELLATFSRAGISHVVAISGMHIAIIAALTLYGLLGLGLSRRQSFVAASLVLTGYVTLIGLPASALRASFMAFLAMLAVFAGRLSSVGNSMTLAAVVLLFFNPLLLRDDIGFQLSFLALLGIVYVKPMVDDILQYKNGITEVVSVTLAAQITTLPLIALYFQNISVIAPLVNLLILFLLPALMVGGLAAALIGIFVPALAWLWFAPVYFLLRYIIFVAEWSVELPLAYVEVEYVPLWWVVVGYAIVIGVVWLYNRKRISN